MWCVNPDISTRFPEKDLEWMFNIDKLTQLAGKPIIQTGWFRLPFKLHMVRFQIPQKNITGKIWVPLGRYQTAVVPKYYPILPKNIHVEISQVLSQGYPTFPFENTDHPPVPRCIILPEEKVRRLDVTMNTLAFVAKKKRMLQSIQKLNGTLPTDTGWLIGILIMVCF